MVAMGFCGPCMASLDQQDSIARHQNQVPLFLHIFQKVEQNNLHHTSSDVSAPANRLASKHDCVSANRITHQSAPPTSSSWHASCEDPDAAGRRDSIENSTVAESSFKRITNTYTQPSLGVDLNHRKYGYTSFYPYDALADATSGTFVAKDVLAASLSYEDLGDGVIFTNQVSIDDTTNGPWVKDSDSLSQFTLGLASNENGLDIMSEEEIAIDRFSASIRKQEIEVVSDRFYPSSVKLAADGNYLMVANDAICKSSSAVKQVDDMYDAFTAKKETHKPPDMDSSAVMLSKDADVNASNAVTANVSGEYNFGQCMHRDFARDDSIGAAMEEAMFTDNVGSTTVREATLSANTLSFTKSDGSIGAAMEESAFIDTIRGPFMNDSRFCASTMKDGSECAKRVTKVINVEREVTHDTGFMKMADSEPDFYDDGSAKVFHDTAFMVKTETEWDTYGAHSTRSLSHVGVPRMTTYVQSLESHQAEGFETDPIEEKLLVSDIEKSGGEESHRFPPGTSHSWQDVWHFQEENSDLTAPFIFESDNGDVINAVLDIAKSLPKNETLHDHLERYSGRIDHLCGNAILYKLQKERLFVSAFSLFEWMRLHTPCLLTPRSLCTIFTISGEANMVDRALVLFNNLKHNKKLWFVQVFNSLLSALSNHRRYDEALSVFQEMSNMKILPDNVTFCILMNLAKRSGSGVKILWQIFCDMEEQKIFAGHEVFAVLMKAFCEEGLRDEALKLLSLMEGRGLIPNIVIYNILIDAFGKAGLLEETEGLVSEMRAKGICMSIVTYNILIDAYGNTRNFRVAEALLQEMLDKGPLPNVCSYTALIAAYGRNFLSEKAASVFLRMKKNGVSPNAIAYTALIHAYAEDGWHEKAEYAFENMRREGFIPSVETYTSLLHAFRQAGDLRKVKSVWKMMRSERCIGTRATFNVLLDACAKQGDYAEARDVMYEFNKIGIKPDRKTYNMLINAYARGGQHDRAPEILKEMKNAGFSPDCFTYTTLIFSFLRVRDFSQAFKYHEKMCRDNQLPDVFTYRKLRALLDAKYEIKTERNMKAVIGAQRAQYSLVEDRKKVKSFRPRQIHRESTRY